ncbi:uncharacterized protein LOC127813770 isoform X1 [Diospyros lotus]|uniref:uncharacterized protein LOC127813770 isoform X1 n=1 Tax=Diospyros lotus TaxID=55363 RepID=UPI0022542289|nr:uncharacterized protein LOC127813770 isoform X1 [Diospyros lotus]XP_052210871.1 uncharacterized protein LOC127813770 isoform X1 [Diospyros lotus]
MTFEFGRTHVVRPRGTHQATIVWLHGLGDNGSSWSQLLETLPLPNIKWICPTAPTRRVAMFGGRFPCTAWFDVGEISEDAPEDLEGLDASAMHVANLLSTEPPDSRFLLCSFLGTHILKELNIRLRFQYSKSEKWGTKSFEGFVKLGVGGFSMGAATALYSATCHVFRCYGNGNPYPINLSAVVGLSGWLPCSRTLRNRLGGSHDAVRHAAALPILLCHGLDDEVVSYDHGEKSARALSSAGFQNLTFRTYSRLAHYTIPEETNEVCNWLTTTLGLEGSE